MKGLDTVEVPMALRKRPKDRRGYPIPYVVFRDTAGRPHFTINDQERHAHVTRKALCSLCGGKLKEAKGRPGAWFIGGPICFVSPLGAFLDPAMHEDCARYAVQVCPYIAAPRYATRLDDRTLKPEFIPEGVVVAGDLTQQNDRPTLFALGQCAGYEAVAHGNQTALRKVGEWLHLEFWQHGRQLGGEEAQKLVALDLQRHG